LSTYKTFNSLILKQSDKAHTATATQPARQATARHINTRPHKDTTS